MGDNKFSRREFIKRGIRTGLSGAGAGIFLMLTGKLSDAVQPAIKSDAGTLPDLSVIRKGTPEKAVRRAIELIGGMKKFVAKNDVVVVKPNIGWDRAPEYAATTNPEVVSVLVRMAFEAGAKKVKVFDRACDNVRRCYVNSGIEKAAKDAGAEVYSIQDGKKGYVTTKINGVSLKEWSVYGDVLECNCFINVPVAKHHGSTDLTLSMKNLMGVAGGDRGKFHTGGIDQWIADFALAVKTHLVVIDARRILLKNGPSGGNLEDVREPKTIIASADQVAADAYATTLFGKKPSDIKHIVLACRDRGGEIDVSKLRIAEENLE